MADLAIKAEHISKIFRIYDKPTDRLREAFSFNRQKYFTDFRALNDVSFEVKKGEFLGIVGKNGAGKSTLLKILSRELTPSAGSVTINGKVSLLQLGIGFDPELTGIENARFASKLLGYSDEEIEGMIDEIIAFADIGEFIKHPVKTYSSGMYSRLSFAVGVNIDPDILIADEVLAVGDMRFSQKCLRKMREFKEKGKTIVLVTHDTGTVNVFCDTAIWLRDGCIYQRGDAKSVTTNYINYMLYDKLPEEYNALTALDYVHGSPNAGPAVEVKEINYGDIEWDSMEGYSGIGDGRAEIKRMAFLLADTKKRVQTVQGNERVILLMDVLTHDVIETPHFGYVIYNQQGIAALHSNNEVCGKPFDLLPKGRRLIAKFEFDLPNLGNGHYIFAVGVQSGVKMPHRIHDVHEFRVMRNDIKGTQCGYVIVEKEQFEIEFVSQS